MKVVIVGPGAMGLLFASYLSKSEQEVWLLDKEPSRAERLNRLGISIEGVSGVWKAKVKVSADPDEIGRSDLVVVCVKSYDTQEAIRRARPIIDKDSTLLTLQNGIGAAGIISQELGGRDVLSGITSQGANLIDTGRLSHAGVGETVIGSLESRHTSQLQEVCRLFNEASIPTSITNDIEGALWSKLVVNTGINALSAITRLRNGQLLEFEATRRIMKQAVSEATRIVERRGIKLRFDDPLKKLEEVCLATANNISSMLADVLKEKRTEIDFINGVVIGEGQSLGIDLPVNRILVDLIRTIESSYGLRADKSVFKES